MRLIFNGDDFGASREVNEAIVQAHLDGLLTSTSLMVAGDAWEEAVALARDMPSLDVGLHLVVVEGRALLEPGQLPHLVDGDGYFRGGPVALVLRYALNRAARAELAAEVTAQFERFASTGLPFSHINSHLHIHMHPVVLELVLALARQHGVRGMRIPRDEFWLSATYDPHMLPMKVVWAMAFSLLGRHALARMSQHVPLAVVERVYGLMQTGRMSEDYVLRVLTRSKARTAELYFHPSTGAVGEKLGPNRGDLAALMSPAVREAVEERGHTLVTYSELAEA